MDIIKLYESRKPYNPALAKKAQDSYLNLLDKRNFALKCLIPVALIVAISSRKLRTGTEIFRNFAAILLLGGVANEVSIWNEHIGKLYLIYREAEID